MSREYEELLGARVRIAGLEADLARARTPLADPKDLTGQAASLAIGTQGYGGGTAIPPEVEQALAQQGMEASGAFGPGRPLSQFFPWGTPPRTRDYPSQYNVGAQPRSKEVGKPSFDTLKAIIDNYDVAQLCVNHLLKDLRSLPWQIKPAPGVGRDVTNEVEQARIIMAKPDGRTRFRSWQHRFAKDVLKYDAGTLFRQRNRKGEVIGLEVVSGRTIAVLQDYFGRPPLPPAPSHVQWMHGVPSVWLTGQDIIYEPYNADGESPYGTPPVEWMLLSANTDIRLQLHFLYAFTEGAIPDTWMEAPQDLSEPAQLRELQSTYDTFLEGFQEQKHKVRWVPFGSKPIQTKPTEFNIDFAQWMLRKCCAGYGVTPADIGFTDQVNKSSGETQADVQQRTGRMPLTEHLEEIYTVYLQEDRGLPVEFAYDLGREQEDRLQEAQAMDYYIRNGSISTDEVRKDKLGLPVDSEHPVPRFVVDRNGITPLRAVFAMAGATDADTASPTDSEIDTAITEAATPEAPEAPVAAPDATIPAADQPPPAGNQTPAPKPPEPGSQQPVQRQLVAQPIAAGLAVKAMDTGRVLLIQRSNKDIEDPARGMWEFPGGHIDDGESPLDAARREWCEECGCALPDGDVAGTWLSPNGIYRGFVYVVDREADVEINLEHDSRTALNPDDPDGDDIEVAAWWDPTQLPGMRALRTEAKTGTDWYVITHASNDGAVAASLRAKVEDLLGEELARLEATTATLEDLRGKIPELAGV